ncbi:MAG TPA: Ku protein [Thermaerobacter sp.]
MRSLWRGVISFGLVNIPVRMYLAVEEKAVRFRQLHQRCGTPIRYRRWCPRCDVEVPTEEVARGYEYAPDRFVLITDEDLAGLPLPTARAIEILDFVQGEAIDPIYFQRTYYLEPVEGGIKAYRLLRRAMDLRRCVAIAKVALRNKETLACLRTFRHQALALVAMAYPDEIRPLEALPAFATLGPSEPVRVGPGNPSAAESRAGQGGSPNGRPPGAGGDGRGRPPAAAAVPPAAALRPDGWPGNGGHGPPTGGGTAHGTNHGRATAGADRRLPSPAVASGAGGDGAGDDRELELALHLIDRLTTRFDPGRYRDRYREALLAVVQRKLQGQEAVVTPPEPAPVLDLMEALRASLEQVESRRGADTPVR